MVGARSAASRKTAAQAKYVTATDINMRQLPGSPATLKGLATSRDRGAKFTRRDGASIHERLVRTDVPGVPSLRARVTRGGPSCHQPKRSAQALRNTRLRSRCGELGLDIIHQPQPVPRQRLAEGLIVGSPQSVTKAVT